MGPIQSLFLSLLFAQKNPILALGRKPNWISVQPLGRTGVKLWGKGLETLYFLIVAGYKSWISRTHLPDVRVLWLFVADDMLIST